MRSVLPRRAVALRLTTALAAALLLLAASRTADAQINNLKQLCVCSLMIEDPGLTGITPGEHRVRLVSDGLSNTLVFSESSHRATLESCPRNLAEGAFGNDARASTRVRRDGALIVTLESRVHPGCVATAVVPRARPRPEAALRSGAMR